MRRREFLVVLSAGVACSETPQAQPRQQVVRRVGVVIAGDSYESGGGLYYAGVDGLRQGLEAAGFQEGPRFALLVRDGKGDLATIGQAAKTLELELRVDV